MTGNALRTGLILLLPRRGLLAADRVTRHGKLARWNSRGDRLPDQPGGSDAMLRECFDLPGERMPTAALTRELDGMAPDDAVWLRADPAHVRPDMVSARMLACGDLGLSRTESDEFLCALKPLFGDAGLSIEAGTPTRWYVGCAGDVGLPEFAPPEVVLGDDLRAHLPAGDAGRRWRALLNEAQIVLHNHSLNAERNARGEVIVNSVWFWGAGRRPDWVRTDVACAVSNDALLRALALRAGIACDLNVGKFDEIKARRPHAAGTRLLDLRRVSNEPLERDWLVPIDAALQARRIGHVDMLFQSGERYRVGPRHRWRLWRAIRPLDA
ncbi:MAG: phosphoglycerate mutase [Rhodanobacteraceae bacterium]